MISILRFVAILLFLPLLVAAPAGAVTQYRVIEGHPIRVAYGMNNLGALAGVKVDENGRMYPAVGTLAGVQQLPALLPGGEGRALTLNDLGEVAGNAMVPAPFPFPGLVSHAWYWSEATGPVDLTPGISGASFAYAISNAGDVVGYRMEGDNSGPFLWRVNPGGAVEEHRIGKPESTSNTANDVNDHGLVAGTHFDHAWIYDARTGVLEPLPMSERGSAYGLNDRDEVVGHYRDPAFVPRAALWRKVDGSWILTDLGALPDPNRSCSAIEINNAGTIIGECIGPIGVATRPFVWAGSLRPIDELLIDSDAEHWRVVAVYDIDESGRILAAGRLDGGPAQVVILEPLGRRRPARR